MALTEKRKMLFRNIRVRTAEIEWFERRKNSVTKPYGRLLRESKRKDK